MESVASMDGCDRATMSEGEGSLPWHVDAVGVSLARRPRLYWISWDLEEGDGVSRVWSTFCFQQSRLSETISYALDPLVLATSAGLASQSG